jgi:hypothetical protein
MKDRGLQSASDSAPRSDSPPRTPSTPEGIALLDWCNSVQYDDRNRERIVAIEDAFRTPIKELAADLVNDHRGIPYDVIERLDRLAAITEADPAERQRAGRLPGGGCRFCHAIGVHYEGCPALNVCHHGNGLTCRECQLEAEAEEATWD